MSNHTIRHLLSREKYCVHNVNSIYYKLLLNVMMLYRYKTHTPTIE